VTRDEGSWRPHRPWLSQRLQQEAARSNAYLGDDELQEYSTFFVRGISLPQEGDADWELEVGFQGEDGEEDLIAFLSFEGWRLRGISWCD